MTKDYIRKLAEESKNDEVKFIELLWYTQKIINKLCNKYKDILGYDDCYSICLEGFCLAVKNYNSRNPSFFNFARLVMWRRLENETKKDRTYQKIKNKLHNLAQPP